MTARFNGDIGAGGKFKLRKLDHARYFAYHFGKSGPAHMELKRDKRERSLETNAYIHYAFDFIALHVQLTPEIVKDMAKLALLLVPKHEVIRRLVEMYTGDKPMAYEQQLFDMDLPPVCHPTSGLSVEAMNIFIENLPAWARETFDVGLPLPNEVNIYD